MSTKAFLLLAAAAALVLTATLLPYRTGAWPGISTGFPLGVVPADATRAAPGCSLCHVAALDAPRPRVSLVPSGRILKQGESITLTTSSTEGVPDPLASRSAGGFATDATAGTFTAGSNSKVDPSGTKVTHTSSTATNGRSWTYGYTAPNLPGLVEVYTVVNTANGNLLNSGDTSAFHGFEPTNTMSTPVRLYVLPTGIELNGDGCPDGFGNVAVLGSTEVPTVGNQAFGLEIAGASPGQLAVLFGGFNPPGFQPLDLGAFGVSGCSGYVDNPITVVGTTTTPGNESRADGQGILALPIPDDPNLVGVGVDLQAAYLDPSALQIGRSQPVTFTNGLHITLQ